MVNWYNKKPGQSGVHNFIIRKLILVLFWENSFGKRYRMGRSKKWMELSIRWLTWMEKQSRPPKWQQFSDFWIPPSLLVILYWVLLNPILSSTPETSFLTNHFDFHFLSYRNPAFILVHGVSQLLKLKYNAGFIWSIKLIAL